MSFDLSKIGVELNIPKVNFMEYNGIMEAPEKYGKTTFAMLYPKSIIVAAEIGYKAQVANKKDITSWEDFRDFIDLLEEHREEISDDIRTIIIDTIDKLYPMTAEYICKIQSRIDGKKYNKIKDIPYGQGWQYHDAEFDKQLKRIKNLGFTIFYLTHSIIRTIKPKEGEPYDVYKSTMPDRCAEVIFPDCDYIIHGERRKINDVMKRVLVLQGNNESVAGNRVYFSEPIVFDTEEEAMEKFKEQFSGSIQKILDKSGIKTDIKKLAKQQETERQENIKNYIDKSRQLSKDEMVEIIKINFPTDDGELKTQAKEIMKKYNIKSFKNPEELDIDGLQELCILLNKES